MATKGLWIIAVVNFKRTAALWDSMQELFVKERRSQVREGFLYVVVVVVVPPHLLSPLLRLRLLDSSSFSSSSSSSLSSSFSSSSSSSSRFLFVFFFFFLVFVILFFFFVTNNWRMDLAHFVTSSQGLIHAQNKQNREREISLFFQNVWFVYVLFSEVTTKVTQKMAEPCTEYPFLEDPWEKSRAKNVFAEVALKAKVYLCEKHFGN